MKTINQLIAQIEDVAKNGGLKTAGESFVLLRFTEEQKHEAKSVPFPLLFGLVVVAYDQAENFVAAVLEILRRHVSPEVLPAHAQVVARLATNHRFMKEVAVNGWSIEVYPQGYCWCYAGKSAAIFAHNGRWYAFAPNIEIARDPAEAFAISAKAHDNMMKIVAP